MTEAPLLEVAERRDRPALYASWGSWCNLGQTHERWHVDGKGSWARLCIYLKELQVDFHSTASLVANSAGPNDGSRSTATTAVPAEWSDFAEAVVHWKALVVAVVYEVHSWSAWEAATEEEGGEQR